MPLILLVLAACGDGPTQPVTGPLVVSFEGRPERGSLIRLAAHVDGALQAGVTWSATPAAAVTWSTPGEARLLTAGAVTFTAAAAAVNGTLAVDVAVPPSIAFASVQNQNRDIWRLALDGGDALRLTRDPAEELGPTAAGGRVFFLSTRVSPAAVFSVATAGGDAARETTAGGAYAEPATSPDGTRLAFLRDVGGVPKVWIADRNGTNARRLSTSGAGVIEASPAWSPDGATIAFVTTAGGNADIRVAPTAGAATAGTPIAASPAAEVEPAWHPDGSRIAFARGGNDGADLFVVVVANGATTRLTERPGSHARPAWLADGRLVFTHTQQGATSLNWLDPAAPDALHPIPFDSAVSGRPTALR